MVSALAIVLLCFYALPLFLVLEVKRRRLQRYAGASNVPYHEAISALWAWSTVADIIEYDTSLGGNEQLIQLGAISTNHLYRPCNLVAVLFVLLYQGWPREASFPPGYRLCIFTPNCSNFAIGILRRYPFLQAIDRIHRRVRSCNGQSRSVQF